MTISKDYSGLPAAIRQLDLRQLGFRFTESCPATMTTEAWHEAERAYRRFLGLKLMYPHLLLIPDKTVNEVWQAHVLDTRAYRRDCYSVFGYVLDYFPYVGFGDSDVQQQWQQAVVAMQQLEEKHFGASNITEN